METSAYKLFAKNLLIEGDFQAKSTKSGKTVDYKSKEARDDAIKAGDAVELDKDKQDKDTEEPTGKLGGGDYERDFDDSEPEDKPFGGDTGKDADSETGKDYVSKFQGTDEPEDDEEAKAQAFKDMEDEDDMEEESIIINGKKYKPVKESTKPTIFNPKKHLLRETYERIGGK